MSDQTYVLFEISNSVILFEWRRRENDLGAKLMEKLIQLVEAMPELGWLVLMGIVIVISIVAVGGIVSIKRMQIKHTERMAKINQGIDPGDESEAYKKDEV